MNSDIVLIPFSMYFDDLPKYGNTNKTSFLLTVNIGGVGVALFVFINLSTILSMKKAGYLFNNRIDLHLVISTFKTSLLEIIIYKRCNSVQTKETLYFCGMKLI